MSTLPLTAVLYTRRECPLCDEMKVELERAAVPDLDLELVDVDSDPELRDRFGWRIPVLEIGGDVLLEGRWSAAQVARRIAARRQELQGEGA